MSKIDYQALREIAKKATQGEWSAFISPGTGTYAVHTPGDKRCEDVIKWTGFDGQKNAENNARYIAAFNPEVVQALLDERERNQQYIKRRDQENEDIALTVGKLRVELEETKSKLNEQREYYEGVIADGSKRIAELEKQCAEWERKALSNFEECAAMAERIEEMSKQSCEARERDLFESWVMHSICISKSTLEGLRTETGYRNATLSGTDFNRMWKQWKSIRAAGIRIKGE
ncbi:TPA: ead/Ea22-like family protein [Escherichia coli O25b:H4-ST131]|uniref:ead/Ea22-like family protein n=1 Tax=Escherichia coli TaxID=562 RepID=UPI000E354FAE|nr:ead/Ea22-like family protein [Escherichia coli]HAO9770548.1 ead/Ea22-like family protein [Escherichia coli O25b:H4-ST131]HAX6422588.1 ead/Ea22-like family protein [Escherichia coli]HAX6570126.1 ead/Ea22-like family protein [Escherichia coli]HBE3136811.1 ead/Ea22-like family protein [Escherichia coli]HBN5020166.1 ead/Ea22-like family protein [Escherichia coli O25b:H4-ST131]